MRIEMRMNQESVEIDRLQRENEILRQALQFYQNPVSVYRSKEEVPEIILDFYKHVDFGRVAFAALYQASEVMPTY